VADPTQRISDQLPKYTTEDSLKNAKYSSGQPLNYPNTANCTAAATVFSQYQNLQGSVQSGVTGKPAPSLAPTVHNVTNSPSTTIFFSQQADGSIVQDDGSWISDIASNIAEFFSIFVSLAGRSFASLFPPWVKPYAPLLDSGRLLSA
jgi:hypothetical protein